MNQEIPKHEELIRITTESFLTNHELTQHQRIKALMTIRGISQVALARKHGLQRSEVSRVISGDRRTKHIRNTIATELGVGVEQLFRD